MSLPTQAFAKLHDGDFEAAGCHGTTIGSGGQTRAVKVPQEKQSYCDAADTANKAADADSKVWPVWAAASGVCAVGCINPFTSWGGASIWCTGAQLGAGITDALITQNYASMATSIAGAAMSGFMAQNSEEQIAKNGGKEGRIGPCLGMIMAAAQAFIKKMDEKNQDDAAKSNLANAKAYTSNGPAVALPTLKNPSGIGTDTGAGKGGAPAAAPTASPVDTNPACGQSGAAASVACALALDSNLPRALGSSDFLKDLQKSSGMNPDDLFKNMTDPTQGIMASSAGGLSSSMMPTLSAALAETKKMTPEGGYDGAGSMGYASAGGGGGGAKGGGGGDDGMGAMLAGMMEQLGMGPKAGEKAPPGVSEVDFKQMTQPHSQVVQNQSLSIFTRISFRYYYAGRAMFGIQQTGAPTQGVRR